MLLVVTFQEHVAAVTWRLGACGTWGLSGVAGAEPLAKFQPRIRPCSTLSRHTFEKLHSLIPRCSLLHHDEVTTEYPTELAISTTKQE